MECKYVKRKLGVRDLMPVVRMLSRLRISDFKECFSRDNLNGAVEAAKKKLQGKAAKASGQEEEKSLEEKEGQETEQSPESKKLEKDALVKEAGAAVALKAAEVLLTNLPLIEDDLMELLASMCDMEPEAYRELPPGALIVTLREIFSSEEAQDFFTEAARLLNWDSSSGTSSTGGTPALQIC